MKVAVAHDYPTPMQTPQLQAVFAAT